MMNHLNSFVFTGAVLWLLVVAAILVDLWDRCLTERKMCRPVTSHRARKTISKTLEYWRIMAIGLVVDLALGFSGWYTVPYLSVVIAAGLICIEGKSIWEHAIERRSAVVGLEQLCRSIVECVGEKDAMKILAQITEYLESARKK